MKKMLFITPKLPIPAISGGLIGTLSSLKVLPKSFELDVITFIDEENENKEKYIEELKKNGINNIFFIDYKVKQRSILTIIKSIFQSLPLSVYRNKCDKMKNMIKDISANYDFIYADHWLTMQYIPNNFRGIKILKEHNAEYIMWERLFQLEQNFIKKLYLFYELNKIKKYEAKICNKADNVIVVTNDDKKSLKKIGANESKITMLPSVVMDNTAYKDWNFTNRENSIMYVGSLSWGANIDGLEYFINNIYPMIKQRVSDLKFYIIGKNPPDILQQFAQNDSSIVLTGFVEDLTEYYEKCKLFVVYLRYGSGIKIKILEALSNAMPVVTNDVGMEGICTEGAELANTDKEFTDKVCELINDNKKLKYMSEKGIEYINNNYSEKEYIKFFNVINGGES